VEEKGRKSAGELEEKLKNVGGAEDLKEEVWELKDVLARVIEEERTALTRE
jgi:hypothetical protein